MPGISIPACCKLSCRHTRSMRRSYTTVCINVPCSLRRGTILVVGLEMTTSVSMQSSIVSCFNYAIIFKPSGKPAAILVANCFQARPPLVWGHEAGWGWDQTISCVGAWGGLGMRPVCDLWHSSKWYVCRWHLTLSPLIQISHEWEVSL